MVIHEIYKNAIQAIALKVNVSDQRILNNILQVGLALYDLEAADVLIVLNIIKKHKAKK